MNLHREHLTAECCEALATHQRAANRQASRWIERELRRALIQAPVVVTVSGAELRARAELRTAIDAHARGVMHIYSTTVLP